MRFLAVVDKNNGIVKQLKQLGGEIFIASFDREGNANFVPSEEITNVIEGYNFLDKVSESLQPDAIFFASDLILKETASYFSGKKGLGLIAHSKELRLENGKLIGLVPGGNNLFAEVLSISHPVLLILKGDKKTKMPHINPEYISFSKDNKLHLESIEEMAKDPIKSARIVIGVGRGVKSSLIPAVEQFAKTIGAEVGCTRPVSDIGLLPEERMIGETGLDISPDIYIALGISGALQHMTAINAKYIIAVNNDPDAPIFSRSKISINQPVEIVLENLRECLKNFSL